MRLSRYEHRHRWIARAFTNLHSDYFHQITEQMKNFDVRALRDGKSAAVR
jgi:hypothetical protein